MNRLFNFVVISVVLFNFKVQCELPLCTRAGDLFSYKYDCNKYWECENDEDVILKNCPLGLEFNNSTKVSFYFNEFIFIVLIIEKIC